VYSLPASKHTLQKALPDLRLAVLASSAVMRVLMFMLMIDDSYRWGDSLSSVLFF
jgi:hypothetical protein